MKQKVAQFVYKHTYFFASMYHALKAQKQSGLSTRHIAETAKHDSEAYDVTGRMLLAANDFVTKRGARFIVISDPKLAPRFADFLDKTLASAGIPYLPLYEAFAEAKDEPLLIENDVHWNALGHKRVASAVGAFMLANGVFEPD